MGTPSPSLHLPVHQSKGCCGETPQLPSQQTDQPLCPGSWFPWKPPISFPVGAGCRGFSLLRSITEQVSSSHPLFPEDLPRAPYRGLGSPFRGSGPAGSWGLADPHPPRAEPRWALGGSARVGTRHLPAPPWPCSSGHCPHTVLWSAPPTPSFPASGWGVSFPFCVGAGVTVDRDAGLLGLRRDCKSGVGPSSSVLGSDGPCPFTLLASPL